MARLVSTPSLCRPFSLLPRIGFLTIAVLAGVVGNVDAQVVPGLPVNSPQIPVPLGSINPLTQDVHLEIPIASIPQRNSDPMIAKLIYDTQYFARVGQQFAQGFGWRIVFGPAKQSNITFTTTESPCPDPSYPNGEADTNSNFAVVDSNGTYHFATSGLYTYEIICTDASGNHDPNTGQPSSGTATDQDYLGYTFTVTNYNQVDVKDVNGMDANGDKDTNGNYFPTVGPLHDMFGRQAIFFDSTPGLECPAYNQTAPGHIHVLSSDGTTNTYTFNCQTYTVSQTVYNSQNITLLSSVVLPDNSTYSFNYDTGTSGNHFGALTSVMLPTGGQVGFSYSCPFNPPYSLCNLNSTTFGGGTWNFSYGSGTTVTGPARYDSASQQYLNDTTVYSNEAYGGYQVQYYNGPSSLLRTVSHTSPAFETWNVTTTLNDTGQTSAVQWTGLYDHPTQIQEFDFGSSTPTRTTKYSYGVFNKVTSVSVWAGDGTSGSPLSQTTYTYDEYGANYCKNGVPMLASVTGATNHDDTNYGTGNTTRGNVTSISRWVSGTTWVTSHKCYDTLGNVTQEVDELGNPTNYDYSEKWKDTSCIPASTITHGYPTTVTDPGGNRQETTYYTCTGLAQAKQDENDIKAGRAGTTYTYDFAERPLLINYPDGGQISYSYSDRQPLPSPQRPS